MIHNDIPDSFRCLTLARAFLSAVSGGDNKPLNNHTRASVHKQKGPQDMPGFALLSLILVLIIGILMSITFSPQNQQTTYASVLQRPVTSIPQPTPPVQEPFLPANPILTIEDLHLRFHNKPSPFHLENKTSQRSIKRTRNKTASVTQSLSRFLASALPAFSRFLTEMQPKSDTSYPSHPQFHYSRAMRAA